jgi:hypothetical protein
MWHVWGTGEVDTGLWWGDLVERGHFEDPGIGGRIILKWIFNKRDGSMYWIDLTQYRDKWRAVVKAAIVYRVPQNAGNFLTT